MFTGRSTDHHIFWWQGMFVVKLETSRLATRATHAIRHSRTQASLNCLDKPVVQQIIHFSLLHVLLTNCAVLSTRTTSPSHVGHQQGPGTNTLLFHNPIDNNVKYPGKFSEDSCL